MNDQQSVSDILVVDDTIENLEFLMSTLREQGYKVRTATSGEFALRAARSLPPDLILLDVKMPDVDGYEVCRRLKEQPETKNIPVIFLSVASDVQDKVRAFQAGGVDYITRPIQPEEVIVRVETHLKLHAMERALRNSERQLRLIANNTPACISYVGMDDLRYRFVNRRHEETAGMSQDEIVGKHIRDVIGESNYQYALKYIEEVKAGKPASYVNEFDLAEGKRWINVNYVPDIDEDGKVRAVVVSSYDITDLKQAEEALRKSEHQMRLIADNSPAYIAYVGIEDLRYHFVNQKFETGFGIPREEIVGKHIREVIGESNYQFALKYIDQVKSGVPASYVNFFNLEQGKRWVEVNYVPDFDEHGGVKGIVVFSYDVTETKSAEEKLRDSERRLSEIINFLPDPTFAIDTHGRVIIWNKAIEQMTGIKANDMLGKCDYEYALPFYGHRRPIVIDLVTNYDERIASQYDTIRRDGDRLISEVNIQNFGDRGAIWLENVAAPLYDEQSTVVGSIQTIRDITELKETEKKLRESEEFYRQMVETAGEGIFVVDENGKYVFANQRCAEISGYSMDELLTKSAIELIHPEDQSMVADRIRQRIAGDSTDYSYVFRIVSKDGSVKWIHQNSVGIRWNGKPAGLCLVSDITEMKEAEEALRESQEQFALFMDMLPHGVFIKEQDSTCIYVNQYVKDLFHGEHWIGKNAYDAFPDPQLAEAMHADDRRALAAGQTTVEEAMSDKDGVERVFQTTKFRIPRADKSPLLGGIGLDITEQVKAREDLRRSEERYKTLYRQAKETEELYNSLLNSTLDAIVTYDPEGHVTYVNNGFTRLFGWVKEELTEGVPYTPESEREVTMRNVMQVIRDGVPLKDFETKRYTKDEGLVDVSISASRFNDHEGCPAGMLVILRDITDRKQAESRLAEAVEVAEQLRKEAEAANRAKSVFVANMSHEIRTPMNAIIGMTDLALKNDPAPKLRDYLTKIRASSQSLLRIINDILDFSKIEAGRLELESVRFDLRNVISNMSDVVCASEACRDIEFLVSIRPDVPCGLIGDPLRLEQVLTNLASNAVKFTPSGEVLVKVDQLETSNYGVNLKFSVKDTGIGIPAEQVPRLFSSFTQADGSTTRRFGGSGLGLTICRRLVEMMGGQIQVESEPGRGSVFSFQVTFEVQPDSTDNRLPMPADLSGMRVLIVDDNATSQQILMENLKSFSFDAIAVSSGEEAIDELITAQPENPYHLVLLDWKMPGIDGIETARRIDKENRLSGRIPKIIMITAFGTEEVKKQAKMAKLEGFLTKPVQPSLLLDTIMDVFGKADLSISKRAQAKAREAIGAERMRGARILIAEDNAINQQVAKEILEYAGATVQIAWNGKEALEALNDSEFDAVLMDIQMPEMDGYEATRAIRSDGRFRDLPIIAMTAHAMKGDREKCLKEGMNDHVSKPVNSNTLLSTLAEWMQSAGSLAQEPVEGPPVSLFDNQVELPESIPGIDIESALKRLQGNRRLLKKILGDFVQKHIDDARKIRAAIHTNRIEKAQHLSHTLKGSAGNISASDLHLAATKLDSALREKNLEESQRLLVDVQQLLEKLTHAVRSLITPDKGFDREGMQISDESRVQVFDQITPDLKEFSRLLGAYDAKAVETYATVRPQLEMCGIDELIAELDNFIDRYDLKGALGVLNRIAEQLGISLK